LVVGCFIYNNAKKTVNTKIHEAVESIDYEISKRKTEENDPLNILILGIDSKTDESGRSDSLKVMTLKPETYSMQLISIPRDTRTMIAGKGIKDKINHAYAFGGDSMVIDTVENFLGIDIEYHVHINIQGLEELIDELGDVTVMNDVEWTDSHYEFNKGPVEFGGKKELAYVWMRKKDPNGDFGREERQRDIVKAIVEKGANIASIEKVNNTINILGSNLATSLDFDDMKQLLASYTGTCKNNESYQLQGTGTTIDGILLSNPRR